MFIDFKLVKVDDKFNLFAANILFAQDTKEFRFDWYSGAFSGLICLKAVLLF